MKINADTIFVLCVGSGLVMGCASALALIRHGGTADTVRVLECTNNGQTFIPLSTVNENIRATIMGNGVVWSVSNNTGLPYVHEQQEGEFCSVKEEK